LGSRGRGGGGAVIGGRVRWVGDFFFL